MSKTIKKKQIFGPVHYFLHPTLPSNQHQAMYQWLNLTLSPPTPGNPGNPGSPSGPFRPGMPSLPGSPGKPSRPASPGSPSKPAHTTYQFMYKCTDLFHFLIFFCVH